MRSRATKATAEKRQQWRDRRARKLARAAAGRIVLSIEVDEAAICVALVDARLLSPCDQDDRKKLAAGLAKFIAIVTRDGMGS
jgi:hypothetical protein